jgi:hypothetical protein
MKRPRGIPNPLSLEALARELSTVMLTGHEAIPWLDLHEEARDYFRNGARWSLERERGALEQHAACTCEYDHAAAKRTYTCGGCAHISAIDAALSASTRVDAAERGSGNEP